MLSALLPRAPALLIFAVTLALAPLPARAQTTAGQEPAADTLIVTGRASKLYRVDEVVTGKLPTEPLASSQTISVVTDELIRDQGARDAQDLYRNISGVSLFSYAGVTARGFRQEEIFYDGLRGDPYAGFAVPQLFNVARVEFLKGPAGMLYGPGAPGGLFNYITKKPSSRGAAELRGIVGTMDRYGAQAEATGGLGERVALRGGVFYEDRDTPRFNAGSEVFILDGGVSLELPRAELILQGTRYEQSLAANRLRGVPVTDAGDFIADREWNHNEPTDFLALNSAVAQLLARWRPSDGLALDFGVRYNDATEAQEYHEPRTLVDTDGNGVPDLVVREFRDQFRTQESWSLGGNLVWSRPIGRLGNRVLAGFDYFTSDNTLESAILRGAPTPRPGLPGPLSLIDPVYGLSDSDTYDLPAPAFSLTQGYRRGFYLLDELTIGRVILTGGVRHDRFEDESATDSFSDEAWSYRAGAVWRLGDDVSLFGQWATSFEPQGISAQDPRAGGPFEPTTGRVFEGGFKTALMGGRIQSSLSAYHIRRQNILQADPLGDVDADGVDDLISVGEVTAKGVELDLAADLTPDWVLTLAYAYNDTRITEDAGTGGFSNDVGDRFANAPEHQLGFWTRYQIRPAGLALALGGDYVSERLSLDAQRVKPYLVFDASLSLVRGPWALLLRVDNILDKTYAASGFNERGGHFPGEPRSVFLEASYRF